jgi:hypothetical protein
LVSVLTIFVGGDREIVRLDWEGQTGVGISFATFITEQLATRIREFPVLFYDLSRESIVAVNDAYVPTARPRQPQAQGCALESDFDWLLTTQSDYASSETMRGNSQESGPPSDPPRRSERSEFRPPFVGVFTVRGAQKHTQKVQVGFHLEIATLPPLNRQNQAILSKFNVKDLEFLLPVGEEQRAPHLQFRSIRLGVGPLPPDGYHSTAVSGLRRWPEADYVPLSPTPNMQFFTTGLSTYTERGVTGRMGFAGTATIQGEVNAKKGKTIHEIPIAAVLNLPKSEIGVCGDTREQFWQYRLSKAKSRPLTLVFPEHGGAAKYPRGTPLTSLFTTITTYMELNRKITPKRNYLNKSTGARFSMGCNAAKLQFVVQIERRLGQEFIQYGRDDSDPSAPTLALSADFSKRTSYKTSCGDDRLTVCLGAEARKKK